MKFQLIAILVSIISLTNGEQVLYEGYKVYEIVPETIEAADNLHAISKSSENYDFWKLSKIPNDPAHVMVPPLHQDKFEEILQHFNLNFSVINQDISESILSSNEKILLRGLTTRGVDFKNYHRFNDINAYLDELANKYRQRVSVTTVGKSYEGRPLKTIKITNGDGKSGKKVIFVDAGVHAREWIAPATALYIIHQLVENFNENRALLEKLDWVVLPVVNPDGYEYTHTKERFWRKTRKPNSRCAGTDGNRNFGYHWGEVGASKEECSETFRGSVAFSEPETQVVKSILQSVKGRCKFYLTLHSYGRYLLYPWGWTSTLPNTWKDIDEVAQAGASAMRTATGSKYTVGSSTNVLYAAAGGSDDYAFGSENVPISITMELPANSFNPPPSQISSMVSEAWVGIKAMAKKVEQKYA